LRKNIIRRVYGEEAVRLMIAWRSKMRKVQLDAAALEAAGYRVIRDREGNVLEVRDGEDVPLVVMAPMGGGVAWARSAGTLRSLSSTK